MGYQIKADDNYNLIQLNDTFGSEDLLQLSEHLDSGLLETPYLIIQAVLEQPCGDILLQQFANLDALLRGLNGMMVFVDFDSSDQTILHKLNLTTIPSFDEAVDYIFMDQLEKELND